MTLDQWNEHAENIEMVGQSVEELVLLVNWCSDNEVMYTLSVPNQKASGSKLSFVMTVTCSNAMVYELRKMWMNYKNK